MEDGLLGYVQDASYELIRLDISSVKIPAQDMLGILVLPDNSIDSCEKELH